MSDWDASHSTGRWAGIGSLQQLRGFVPAPWCSAAMISRFYQVVILLRAGAFPNYCLSLGSSEAGSGQGANASGLFGRRSLKHEERGAGCISKQVPHRVTGAQSPWGLHEAVESTWGQGAGRLAHQLLGCSGGC